MTELQRAIRSQPSELERLVTCDVSALVGRLEGARRVWLVGTGSSQHVAELGALVLTGAGLDARWSGSFEFARLAPRPGPGDAVILISHTTRTAYALAAREVAVSSGATVTSITGCGGGWPEAIETVAMERSQTYTVSVTSALMVLLLLAGELGARGLARSDLSAAVQRMSTIVVEGEVPEVEPPDRALVLVGSGAGAVSAREGALKLREAARVIAEGYGAEYLLHGHAVPLSPRDSLLVIGAKADGDGLLGTLGRAAAGEGLAVAYVDEPSIGHPVLAQLPIIARLQLLASRLAQARAADPDTAIVGHWADDALWTIGRPE